MGTQLPKKGSEPPIFGPCLLRPNGWTDQDATLYGDRPRPRPHCARWGPSSLPRKKGTALRFLAYVCCGQTAGWIKMPLDTKVGVGAGHIVLLGDPASTERSTAPNFRPMSIVAKRPPISATAELVLLVLRDALCTAGICPFTRRPKSAFCVKRLNNVNFVASCVFRTRDPTTRNHCTVVFRLTHKY